MRCTPVETAPKGPAAVRQLTCKESRGPLAGVAPPCRGVQRHAAPSGVVCVPFQPSSGTPPFPIKPHRVHRAQPLVPQRSESPDAPALETAGTARPIPGPRLGGHLRVPLTSRDPERESWCAA